MPFVIAHDPVDPTGAKLPARLVPFSSISEVIFSGPAHCQVLLTTGVSLELLASPERLAEAWAKGFAYDARLEQP